MLKPSNVTMYAVARDQQIISDGYDDPAIAARQLQSLTERTIELGLEPDLRLVTVEVRTTLGRPKTYDPAPPAPVEPAKPKTKAEIDPATAANPGDPDPKNPGIDPAEKGSDPK